MKPHQHVALEQLQASRLSIQDGRTPLGPLRCAGPVPLELIENAIRCASLAPSGANQQPWKFIVLKDPQIKHRIREAAEADEPESYEHPVPAEYSWKHSLRSGQTGTKSSSRQRHI